MVDVTADLPSLCFESGLTDDEKKLLHLRERAAGRTICGCAHATFICKLLHTLRSAIKCRSSGDVVKLGEDSDLRVGIVGAGHIGKQLLLFLREKTDITPMHIKISTRRSESAASFSDKGTESVFDNGRLAAWAQVLFLCCRPAHLPTVCAQLRPQLPKHCLVYSLTSAAPVSRLAQLLGHSFILKPQYSFACGDDAGVWRLSGRVAEAFRDPRVLEASCPLASSGGVSLDERWVCAVLCSLLNVCTLAGVPSNLALALIDGLFRDKRGQTLGLDADSFMGPSAASSSLPGDQPFPWIDLTHVQTTGTPLSIFLSGSNSARQCFSAAYKSLMETKARD